MQFTKSANGADSSRKQQCKESQCLAHVYAHTCVSHCPSEKCHKDVTLALDSVKSESSCSRRHSLQGKADTPWRTESGLKKFLVRCTKAGIYVVPNEEGRRSSSSSNCSLSRRSKVKEDDNLRQSRSAKTLRNAIVRAVK